MQARALSTSLHYNLFFSAEVNLGLKSTEPLLRHLLGLLQAVILTKKRASAEL